MRPDRRSLRVLPYLILMGTSVALTIALIVIGAHQ